MNVEVIEYKTWKDKLINLFSFKEDIRICYLFDCPISKDNSRDIQTAFRKYESVLHITKLPDDFFNWTHKNLVKYPMVSESCMGEPYTRFVNNYTVIYLDDSILLFLKSALEKQLIIDNFPEIIINKNPFKTIIFK